jgi:hypothetical protein
MFSLPPQNAIAKKRKAVEFTLAVLIFAYQYEKIHPKS